MIVKKFRNPPTLRTNSEKTAEIYACSICCYIAYCLLLVAVAEIVLQVQHFTDLLLLTVVDLKLVLLQAIQVKLMLT